MCTLLPAVRKSTNDEFWARAHATRLVSFLFLYLTPLRVDVRNIITRSMVQPHVCSAHILLKALRQERQKVSEVVEGVARIVRTRYPTVNVVRRSASLRRTRTSSSSGFDFVFRDSNTLSMFHSSLSPYFVGKQESSKLTPYDLLTIRLPGESGNITATVCR